MFTELMKGRVDTRIDALEPQQIILAKPGIACSALPIVIESVNHSRAALADRTRNESRTGIHWEVHTNHRQRLMARRLGKIFPGL